MTWLCSSSWMFTLFMTEVQVSTILVPLQKLACIRKPASARACSACTLSNCCQRPFLEARVHVPFLDWRVDKHEIYHLIWLHNIIGTLGHPSKTYFIKAQNSQYKARLLLSLQPPLPMACWAAKEAFSSRRSCSLGKKLLDCRLREWQHSNLHAIGKSAVCVSGPRTRISIAQFLLPLLQHKPPTHESYGDEQQNTSRTQRLNLTYKACEARTKNSATICLCLCIIKLFG